MALHTSTNQTNSVLIEWVEQELYQAFPRTFTLAKL